MNSDLPTARDYLKSNVRLLIWCKACRHQIEIEFRTIVDQGKGDTPVVHLRFGCDELRLPPDRLRGVGIALGTKAVSLGRLIDAADTHAGIQHDVQRLARPPLHRLRIPLHDHRGKRCIPIPADVAQFAAQQGDLA